MTPTARTLHRLRETGWTAEVVERWVPRANVRRDLFGFADVFAFRDGASGQELLLVQVTTGDHAAARRRKICKNEIARAWLKIGGTIQVHAWSKRGKRGERKIWECRVVEIVIEDFV